MEKSTAAGRSHCSEYSSIGNLGSAFGVKLFTYVPPPYYMFSSLQCSSHEMDLYALLCLTSCLVCVCSVSSYTCTSACMHGWMDRCMGSCDSCTHTCMCVLHVCLHVCMHACIRHHTCMWCAPIPKEMHPRLALCIQSQ